MKRHLVILAAVAVLGPAPLARAESSWVFRPSYYSHDPATGERTAQFAPKAPSLAPVDPNYVRSGYRHKRSTLRGADGSADRMHLVETWGAGADIRPYGEWLFPYRAGATPYGPWGNPQGPWTAPFDSWVNPYGLLNHHPFFSYPGPYGGSPRAYGHGGGPRRPGNRGPHAPPPHAHLPGK